MKRSVCALAMAFLVNSSSLLAQVDMAGLSERYKAYDSARNSGRGFSDSADSGTLGWGEGAVIRSYAQMWEATEDSYWLAKIAEHFQRIMDSASDPDGDGFLSWSTKTYSCAAAYAERLHNVSATGIEPAFQKNLNGDAAAKCSGHTYLIEFPRNSQQFSILDRDARSAIATDVAYDGSAAITQIEPFRFKLSGPSHQGDRFLIRTVAPEPLEFAVHQGMFVYPTALFIEAVKSRPALQPQFGADAEKFLAFINKHVFEKNEQDWLDMGELGGAYRFQSRITERYPNRILPHNQFAALARAWLVLRNVAGAHPLMAQRAEQMVRYLHSHLELDEPNDAYRWHYWDWIENGERGHSGYEDTSHAALNVSLAVEAARRDVIFTGSDMTRLANTWLRRMWNQDEQQPRMAAAVDGRKPHEFSPLTAHWSELSEWNRKTYELARHAFLSQSAQEQAGSVPILLLCAKRAGVRLP
jgi:hypothetical protein